MPSDKNSMDMIAPILTNLPDITPKRGRSKCLTQKPATTHKLKDGKWAVFVNLVEPRELEGKVRNGRQKFERQTEALANDLCVEINSQLFNRELARQLSLEETALAKKLFWEILEPRHPDWIPHLDQAMDFCEKAGFQIASQNIPTVAEAARLYWREHVVLNLKKDSHRDYYFTMSLLVAAFGHLKPNAMTDQMILQFAAGDNSIKTCRSSNCNAADGAGLWDMVVDSKTKRPWNLEQKAHFFKNVRAFKNWMHSSLDPVTQSARNWCPASTLKTPINSPIFSPANDSVDNGKNGCPKALSIPQIQALIDAAWVAFGGRYAAFYIHALWCGCRAREISRTVPELFDSNDGMLFIPDSVAKTNKGREVKLFDNAIVMVETLRNAGLYTRRALRPGRHYRTVIQILAGFRSGDKKAHATAAAERERMALKGVTLPANDWRMPYPYNRMRHTSLSMHYKLFQNVALTTGWGGNSPGVFKEYYKKMVTKEEARQFWVMLPTCLSQGGNIPIQLPDGHQLDSALTTNVTSSVSAAREIFSQLQADMLEAKLKSKEAANKDQAKAD